MKNDLVPVEIRGILPAGTAIAVFLGNDEKIFVIQMDPSMGPVIDAALRNLPKDRPQTHDLMGLVFKGFGITIDRVVITALRLSTFLARIVLRQENQLGTKLVELDARPSDCLALAAAAKRPIFVARSLFDEVEDMTNVLANFQKLRAEQEAAEAEDGDDGNDGDEDEARGEGPSSQPPQS
jgi:bifunctional DNase/RNase